MRLDSVALVLPSRVLTNEEVVALVGRHSAATYMLRRGMNPLLVAKIFGHESLAMITRTYSHLTVDDAHEALMAALRADSPAGITTRSAYAPGRSAPA